MASAISPLTFSTATRTPLPAVAVVAVAQLDRLVLAVDAPDEGRWPAPPRPDSKPTTTSTVGLPRAIEHLSSLDQVDTAHWITGQPCRVPRTRASPVGRTVG